MQNFDNICRTCSLEGELQSLFADNFLSPAEMLGQTVDIKVIKGDKYPQNICTRCLDTLKSAYLFKNQCQNVHKKFEQYLSVNSDADTITDCKEELLNVVFIKEEQFDRSETDGDWLELDNESGNNSEEKHYGCEKSSVKFKNKKKYDRNLKNHKELPMCSICGEQFSSKFYLEQHSFKHSVEKPYKCEKCNMQFTYKKNYERHLKKHEQLNIVSAQFSSKSPLEQQSRDHSNGTDEYCDKSYCQSQVKLKNACEILSVPIEKTESLLNKIVQKKKFLCDYCGNGFMNSYTLNAHIRTHTGEKPFACTECNKFFTEKSLLSHHNRIHHTKEKRYKCGFCEKSFAMSHWLKEHVRIHTNDKPFTCDICNQKFRAKPHLTRHQFVHTGEKPFSCSVCNKKFTQNSNLRSHMRTHTGEKPYVCSICNAAFHDSSSMKNHRAKHILCNTEESHNVSSVSNKKN